jgi:hypothetical protein
MGFPTHLEYVYLSYVDPGTHTTLLHVRELVVTQVELMLRRQCPKL